MKENLNQLKQLLERHGELFTAVNCELLIPTPGCEAFDYICHPSRARVKADGLGLRINEKYLDSVSQKYREGDLFDSEELVQDFIKGCCPEITVDIAYEFLDRTLELIQKHGVVYEGKLPV